MAFYLDVVQMYLRPEIENLGRAAVRITKYIQRGLNVLYPRDFPIHRLLSIDDSATVP